MRRVLSSLSSPSTTGFLRVLRFPLVVTGARPPVENISRLQQFKECSKANILGISAVLTLIAGILTTIIVGARKAIVQGAQATLKFGKAVSYFNITFQHQNKYEVLNSEDDEATENNNELMRRGHEDSHEVLEYNDGLMTKNRKKIHEGIESQINQPNSSNRIKQSQRAEGERNNDRHDKLNQRQNLPKQ